ncbi:MAG: phenylalanine--tRNA ligase subunit beta, partial [Lewinella sp.]|nr:phenylalanine--tRNA ligase subunit beta [Lewinella sp.]
MKVSLKWLRQYIDLSGLSAEEIGDILTSTGLEVEGIEEVERIPGGLAGIVIGQVKECGKHPNADRLSVTKVDIGGDELLSIVCGAPNVAAGQKVLVATVGAELYPTNGDDPITIKKGKMRGEVSEGMICAEDEIGLGTSHDGILVLPEAAPVGQAASDYFELDTDYVFEIGLTPNRSDATNHLGVAHDLAAALRMNYGRDVDVKLPDVSGFKVNSHDRPIAVEVRNSTACPRYTGVTLTGFKVGESPDWLKERLRAVDVRPINNIVDVTNFVLHELGQPLHAFDLEEVKANKIIVDTLPAGSKFLALDEVERELSDEDLMICDGNEHGMCIGGVFGGIGSGVKESTTAIFLESAHFDAQYIRRTSMRHNLRTDAAKVFEKGSDPNITDYALRRAILLMQELAGGEVSSEVVDIYPQPVKPVHIRVRYARINLLIGVDIPAAKVHSILEAMGMTITDTNDEGFTIAVPTNKADVTREVDVIEEILRIYGFNNVPIPARVTTSMALAPDPDPTAIRNAVADQLAARGFHEMMALSLSESRYYRQHEELIKPEGLV